MIERRRLLLTGGAALAGFAHRPALSQALAFTEIEMRGSIDAAAAGVVPNAPDNQSRRLQTVLNDAAAAKTPVFLPPGDYTVSNIDLPDGTRLTGVPGASRLIYTGDGHLLRADGADRIEISNIAIDGSNGWLGDHVSGLVHLANVGEALIDNCEIAGSRKTGFHMERCGGRIERSTVSGAADIGLYAVECVRLSVRDNRVHDCGNGGILVHRWTKGDDGSVVTGNRVYRIGARDGGTGEYGNGINLFRADNVIVSDNHVSDCAFSAIRANSASNVQIRGNQCLKSGETALYVEFSFEGAVVADNLIDTAANGILIVNFNEGGRLATVTGNLVRNLSLTGPYEHDGAGFGFGISVEADTVVSGNVIENAPRYGMMLGWGPYLRDVVVSGNVVRQSPIGLYVTVVEESGAAVITGNIFNGTKDGAIVGYRWNEKTTGDLMASGDVPPHLTISGNRAT
ncbi:TIGR03808 family TAT-translocated repetitive protein [Ciceribacter sp. L1K23]|uniref:TIGR03808 family TAT-translocated repetitive protein n=1 Tax=Ciceribacter sp. L1K23 TaxID=2820276 RepID=UPI001B81EE7B|nr:TIGR03808 family TAT-translocated repetitive protein [Ciceribacter sp. L1K23]MBR0556386.1 TIGR03808 family TAT-translocated repetitive protein [Ciceribacter sp. L1K23]